MICIGVWECRGSSKRMSVEYWFGLSCPAARLQFLLVLRGCGFSQTLDGAAVFRRAFCCWKG